MDKEMMIMKPFLLIIKAIESLANKELHWKYAHKHAWAIILLAFLKGIGIFPTQRHHEKILVIFAIIGVLLVIGVPNIVQPTPSEPFTCPYVPTNAPVNNTTNKTTPPPYVPTKLRIAVGGDVSTFTPANLDYYKSIGVNEIHVVVPNYGTWDGTAAAIKARGMVAVYDGEMPFWYSRNSAALFSASEMQQLRNIHAAGWDYFSSEGLYGNQVTQINQAGFKYINYGGDRAENLYTLPSFGPHLAESHYANLMEAYDVNLKSQIFSVIYYNGKVTPEHNGILFGLWTNSGTAGGKNPLTVPGTAVSWINELNCKNGHVTTVLFWCGLRTDPRFWLDGQFRNEFNAVRALKY